MRIIDRNTDYYDFYQREYPDDYLVFDRRGSTIVNNKTINWMVQYADNRRAYVDQKDESRIVYLLLESGYDKWVFPVMYKYSHEFGIEITEIGVKQWKAYSSNPSRMILSIIQIPWLDIVKIASKRNHDILQLVKEGHFTRLNMIENPILGAGRLGGRADPFVLYNSIEDYLSFMKTSSERTESVGLTDKEKIVNHGFDQKRSFRKR